MEDNKQLILVALDDLLKLDDVLACMFAKKELEGLVPNALKIKDVELWELLKAATDNMFDIVAKFFNYGLTRMVFELGNYNIIVAPLNEQFSLLVVVPALANTGLLDVEIENTKRKIKHIMER